MNDARSLAAKPVLFPAYTAMAFPRLVFQFGKIVFLKLSTYDTIVNANVTLFAVPYGCYPQKTESFYAHFVRKRDGLHIDAIVILNQDGNIISDFNDDGELWAVDLFYVYVCA